MKCTIDKIEKEVSVERLMAVIDQLSRYHRIQASCGYRAAADACVSILRDYGLDSELRAYTADYGLATMTQQLFQSWDCDAAWCRLLTPHEEMLADYSVHPISLFQKSYACDYRDTPLDIVLLDRGSDPSSYEGLDIRGKIIFIRDDFNAYLDWAVRKGGAIGIISDYVAAVDGVRSREEMWNVRKYTTFWWMEDEPSQPFGFSITPNQGEMLAALCLQMAPSYPKATCFVDSTFSRGTYENVTALLPGETDEEILLLAHLCHPRPSANDNLSGVAAILEGVKVLHDLLDREVLPPLKRGIRLLLVPEYLGTFAYLDNSNDALRIKAGLNLDMVGGKQGMGYGPLTLSGIPAALPSFVQVLCSLVLGHLNNRVPGFSPSYSLPQHNVAECDFVSGSDNFILSDPTIAIPSPMLSQWPDKFYHTSGDDISVISPSLLKTSCACAAAYAYLLANFNLDLAAKVAERIVSSLPSRLANTVSAAERESVPLSFALIRKTKEEIANLRAMEGYFAGDEQYWCQVLCNKAETAMRGILASMDDYYGDGITLTNKSKERMKIPERLYRGPLNVLDTYADTPKKKSALLQYQKKLRIKMDDPALAELFCQYYIDGRRTAASVITFTRLACEGCHDEALMGYLQLLVILELVKMKSVEAEHAD